jgi:hypothetical protein
MHNLPLVQGGKHVLCHCQNNILYLAVILIISIFSQSYDLIIVVISLWVLNFSTDRLGAFDANIGPNDAKYHVSESFIIRIWFILQQVATCGGCVGP